MENQDKNINPKLLNNLTKNDIIEILEHKSFVKTIDQFLEHNKKTQFWKTVSFIVMAFLGIFGFYFGVGIQL